MYRGASSPTLARDTEVNILRTGEAGVCADAVGRVGQTAGASDDHTLLRAHTWHRRGGDRKQANLETSAPSPIPRHWLGPWFPYLAGWQNHPASSVNMQILGALCSPAKSEPRGVGKLGYVCPTSSPGVLRLHSPP